MLKKVINHYKYKLELELEKFEKFQYKLQRILSQKFLIYFTNANLLLLNFELNFKPCENKIRFRNPK